MKKHWCLAESEVNSRECLDVFITTPTPHPQENDIRDESLKPYEQVLTLLDTLQHRGSYGIGSLYLSLRESSDEMYGTPTHYQLAFELRNISECLS